MTARQVLAAVGALGQTLAVAESLTGGLVCSMLVEIPGASQVLRGGVVVYATDLKASLLGVDAGLLARRGAVDPDVAAGMASGVRTRLGADWGLATTGVAGPDPADGHPPGVVFVAVSGPAGDSVRALEIPADGEDGRARVRGAAAAAVLDLLLDVLLERLTDPPT